MADWTTKQRLKGIEYAKKLDLFAVNAPDTHTELLTYRLAEEIRRRFRSTELRKREILYHVRRHNDLGGISINELIEATGYGKNVVYPLAEALEDENLVEFHRIPPAGTKGGRPAIRLFLVNKSSFSREKTLTK